MKSKRALLEGIDRELTKVARALDRASSNIRDADLAPRRNIRRIGEALVNIFEVQFDIYRERPDLLPRLLIDTDLGREVLAKRTMKPERKSRRGSSRKR